MNRDGSGPPGELVTIIEGKVDKAPSYNSRNKKFELRNKELYPMGIYHPRKAQIDVTDTVRISLHDLLAVKVCVSEHRP